LRATCANKSKDGLEQRIRKDAKKWPNPSDYTQHGAISGQGTLGSRFRIPPRPCMIFYSTHRCLSCSST